MFKRGEVWYGLVYLAGREVWRSLSRDDEEAKRKFKKLRGEGPQPSSRTTVAQTFPRWINEYVRTNRNEKGIKLAEYRAKKYLLPALGIGRPARLVDLEELARLRSQGFSIRRAARHLGVPSSTLAKRLRLLATAPGDRAGEGPDGA